MPELPDVETFRRRVASKALHQTIRRAEFSAPEMVAGLSAAALRKRLEGHSLEKAERYGKYLLLKLNEGGWLELHFGMSGYPQYVQTDAPMPRYTRMALRLDHGGLAYVVPRKLGRITLVATPRDLVDEKTLGPDALDPHLDFERFIRLCSGKGAVKCWLMDQTQIAGIGNIYSDEILYQARIHPRRRLEALSRRDLHRLYTMLREVLTTALAHDADPAHMPADWLLPHRHAGERCPLCRGKVQRVTLCGRSAYLCPECQH